MTQDIPAPAPAEQPKPALERALAWIPAALASHVHVIGLLLLGVYLIVLPLCGVHVPASSELIGGNYTNIASSIGASIAAGGTVTLVKHSRHRNRLAEATHRITADLYRDQTGTDHPFAEPKP